MKEVILLTKILFKGSTSQNKQGNKKETGKIILFILVFLYLIGVFGYLSYETLSSLIEFNLQSAFLKICFTGMFIFCVIQTVFTSLNILFFSKDIESLLPLPIKSIKIVMAKLNCILISQYIMESVFLLPVLVVYGYLLKMNVLFYLVSLFIIFIFPIIPVLFTTLIVTIIMKFTNIIKNKDFVQYITVFITIALIIAIEAFTGTTNGDITNQEIANKVSSINDNINNYSILFFTLNPIMNIVLNYNNFNGLFNIMIMIITSLIGYLVICKIISMFYISAVTSIVSAGIKNAKKVDLDKLPKRKFLNLYIEKEFKELKRNPIFFMQCILPSLLFPPIFLIPVIMSLKNVSSQELAEFQMVIGQNINLPFGLAILLAVIVFFYLFNFISITAISRDGMYATFMKYIPISLEKQLFYKVMPGIILNIVPIIYIFVILEIFVPEIQLKTYIYLFIISMIINVFNNYAMIIIDLKNPKLEWMTEYAVVKQNINMLFQMIINFLEIGIIIFVGYKLKNIDNAAIMLTIFFTITTIVIKKYICKNKNKLFRKII